MRKTLVLFCLLLIAGAMVISGCVSSDDKFVDAVTELAKATKPDLDGLNQSIGSHDFAASQGHCRQLVTLYDTHIPRLSAINVSAKYELPKEYMIAGFDNERTGCQVLITSSDNNLGPSMEYFLASANNFSKAVDSWPA